MTDTSGGGGLLSYSAAESARFGFSTYRASMEEFVPSALADEILEVGADLVILRVPSGRAAEVQRLGRWGFPVIPTGTLVFYTADLTKHRPAAMTNRGLDFVPFVEGMKGEMDGLVSETFSGYVNHYQANPLLAGRDLVAGYQEWVSGFAAGRDPLKTAWLVYQDGRPAAFCSVSRVADGTQGEGVLYGVAPWAAGRGVYSDLIRFTQAWFVRSGVGRMVVSTQVENFAVQKVWSREGFWMSRSLDTFHVNALLAHSAAPPVQVPLRFGVDDVRRFAEVSGDRNPIHLDDRAATQAGFDGRVVHGAALQSELSRVLGTVAPGEGTIYIGSSARFFRPVYPERDYTLQVTFPYVDERKRFARVVAKITGEGGLHFLAYGDVVLPRPTPPPASA